MDTLNLLDQIISVEDLIRNYRTVFDRVKKSNKPMIVLRRATPDVVLVDIEWFKKTEAKLRELEELKIERIVNEGRLEYKKGKAKVLKSITQLMKS